MLEKKVDELSVQMNSLALAVGAPEQFQNDLGMTNGCWGRETAANSGK